MSYTFEWKRGDTKALVMTITADGSAMDLSGYSKITVCVTTNAEPTDGTTVLWKEQATILSQTTSKGQISVDMTNYADEDVDVPYFFDVQGIDANGKTDTIAEGLCIYRQDRNKDLV